MLLAGAGRSDVNALNEGSVQCDVEFLQGLQHSDQGIDERVVLDQRHILIHVRSNGAVGQQGYPVVQEVISGRVGMIQVSQSKGKETETGQGGGSLNLEEDEEAVPLPHSPTSLPKGACFPPLSPGNNPTQ